MAQYRVTVNDENVDEEGLTSAFRLIGLSVWGVKESPDGGFEVQSKDSLDNLPAYPSIVVDADVLEPAEQ